jgi:hypothetical protein
VLSDVSVDEMLQFVWQIALALSNAEELVARAKKGARESRDFASPIEQCVIAVRGCALAIVSEPHEDHSVRYHGSSLGFASGIRF